MKRLLRKRASENIELYHATSTQALLKIYNDGALMPGVDAGVVSNGISGSNGGQASGIQNGVYLCLEDVLVQYYDGATDKAVFDSSLPNLPVAIKVSVNTDSLIADYDDLPIVFGIEEYKDIQDLEQQIFEDNGTPYWQQSLDEIEQAVHQGPINVGDIKEVKIVKNKVVPGSILKETGNESVIYDTLPIGNWISIGDAAIAIEELNDIVREDKKEPATAISRLRKLRAE